MRRVINLNLFIELVKKAIAVEEVQFISSLYAFGSLARGETFGEASDIDTVLLLKNKERIPWKTMVKLSQAFKKLDKSLGIKVDHVVLTQDDFLELLSPVIILNSSKDGITILGRDIKKDFKNYLSKCSKKKLQKSLLKYAMFQRHHLRKEMLHLDSDKISQDFLDRLTKAIILLAKDYLFFSTGKLFTKKLEISSNFSKTFDNKYKSLPGYAVKIRERKVILNKQQKIDFLKDGFSFVEKYTSDMEEKYLDRFKERRINLGSY